MIADATSTIQRPRERRREIALELVSLEQRKAELEYEGRQAALRLDDDVFFQSWLAADLANRRWNAVPPPLRRELLDRVDRMTRGVTPVRNVEVITRAASVPAELPHRALDVVLTPRSETVDLAITTVGLDRVDIYVNERAQRTLDVSDGQHDVSVPLEAPGEHALELRGLAAGKVAAARNEVVTRD